MVHGVVKTPRLLSRRPPPSEPGRLWERLAGAAHAWDGATCGCAFREGTAWQGFAEAHSFSSTNASRQVEKGVSTEIGHIPFLQDRHLGKQQSGYKPR